MYLVWFTKIYVAKNYFKESLMQKIWKTLVVTVKIFCHNIETLIYHTKTRESFDSLVKMYF